jgi:hypothetical protein
MSTFIQDSIADGSLVLWHDYRAGHMTDLSGNGNDGTPTSIIWQGRAGIRFPLTTSVVTVADSSELQLTAGTLAVLGEFMSQLFAKRLISKRDAGGANYDWYLGIGDSNIYDGTDTSDGNSDITGHHLHALGFNNSVEPDAYTDGLFAVQYDTVLTNIAADDAPLLIGNVYTGNNQMQDSMQAALIFNRKITATEHAQLYSELHENGGPS